VSAFDLTTVALLPGVDAALALVPPAPGVGQILAEGERNLVIGRPSNLRKWAATHLGRARVRTPAAGKLPARPPTDLTPIATAIAYLETTSPFGQRLAYERLMARYVPLASRRDLKRPSYLRLDVDHRFPHLLVQASADRGDVFGPFRDTRAAARARDALYKHFRIRPCDFDFAPATGLSDGLALEMARALSGAAGIAEIPGWVRRAGERSLIVERVKAGLELYPIAGGGVIEEAAVATALDALEPSIERMAWTCVAAPRDDTPWLNAWRYAKRSGVELPVAAGETAGAIAARIRVVVG